MMFEADRIRDAQFENHARMRETATAEDNARALASFLGIAQDKADEIARTDHLFSD